MVGEANDGKGKRYACLAPGDGSFYVAGALFDALWDGTPLVERCIVKRGVGARRIGCGGRGQSFCVMGVERFEANVPAGENQVFRDHAFRVSSFVFLKLP